MKKILSLLKDKCQFHFFDPICFKNIDGSFRVDKENILKDFSESFSLKQSDVFVFKGEDDYSVNSQNFFNCSLDNMPKLLESFFTLTKGYLFDESTVVDLFVKKTNPQTLGKIVRFLELGNKVAFVMENADAIDLIIKSLLKISFDRSLLKSCFFYLPNGSLRVNAYNLLKGDFYGGKKLNST
jgi:hypothetical protein